MIAAATARSPCVSTASTTAPAESIVRSSARSSSYSWANATSKASSAASPAAAAAASRTPGCDMGGAAGGPRPGRQRPDRPQRRGEVAALGPPPHLDHHGRARPRHPPRLAQRGGHVAGEDERVEARHQVERVVRPGQPRHVADAQVRTGHAAAGDRDEGLGGVEPRRPGPPVRRHAQVHARAAAHVEHRVARRDPDPVEGGRELRGLALLLLGPGRRARAPQAAARLPVHKVWSVAFDERRAEPLLVRDPGPGGAHGRRPPRPAADGAAGAHPRLGGREPVLLRAEAARRPAATSRRDGSRGRQGSGPSTRSPSGASRRCASTPPRRPGSRR